MKQLFQLSNTTNVRKCFKQEFTFQHNDWLLCINNAVLVTREQKWQNEFFMCCRKYSECSSQSLNQADNYSEMQLKLHLLFYDKIQRIKVTPLI